MSKPIQFITVKQQRTIDSDALAQIVADARKQDASLCIAAAELQRRYMAGKALLGLSQDQQIVFFGCIHEVGKKPTLTTTWTAQDFMGQTVLQQANLWLQS